MSHYQRRTAPGQDYDAPIDQAMRIFEDWAQSHNRNYFGDMVRDNLGTYLSQGSSPQEAVDRLVRRAPR